MADVTANITLVTSGGSESASEIMKADSAIQSMTRSSAGMEGQFQHRFQHIGLMLFAGDALRASGLGRETRLVVSALNAALMAGETAGGLASGGILLVVTALAALAGILVTVIKHHKDESEALQKLIDQDNKQYENYQKEIETLNTLSDVGGGLTAHMQALKDADQQVADDLKANMLVALDREVAALQAQQVALQKSADLHAALRQVVVATEEAFKQLLAPFLASVNLIGQWASSLSRLLPMSAQHVALTGNLKLKYDELSAAIAKARVQHDTLTENGTTDLKKLADASVASANARMAADARVAAFQKEQLKEVHEAYSKAYDERQKETEENAKKINEVEKKVADQIGSDFGNAFAKALVEGKSFTEQMKEAFTRMAEQIIADIVKMIVEQEILLALETATGTVGGGGGGLARLGGFFPTGGSRIVDTPTMFVAGDSGPELATFTPLGSAPGGDSGGGAAIQIGSINTTVNGVQDPSRIADQVGDQIVQRIRGMGDINFTR